jgi:inner membrane protease ATP23
MEFRKSNLANCNYGVYLSRVDADFAVTNQHKVCVENTAVEFLVKTKFVEEKLAREAVQKIFPKCYQDLEPIGRRVRHNNDMKSAEKEKYMFGYE